MAGETPSAHKGNSIDVLVVEDNPLIAAFYAKILRREADLHADFATNVGEAYAKLSVSSFDVVLVDYKLPDGDGLTAAARIRDDHPQTGVVLLTGVMDANLAVGAFRAGCSASLSKADDLSDLVRVIRAAHAGSTAALRAMLAPRSDADERPAQRILSWEHDLDRL